MARKVRFEKSATRARVAQVGAGAVGAATGKALGILDFDVVFVDIDPAVLAQLRAAGLEAVTPEELDGSDVDVYLVSVPTYTADDPRDGTGFLQIAARQIGEQIRRAPGFPVVAIRSTVLPGTTEKTVIPILEESSGRRLGSDFGVCVNPEYLRERSALRDFLDPPAVVIGESDARAGATLERLYDWAACPVHRVSLDEAEMQKVVHNVFNAAKISFFNEAREICASSGVDPKTVFRLVCESAEAMRVPAYGTLDLGPFGGSCLPKDTLAYLSHSERRGVPAPLVRAVLRVNEDLKGGGAEEGAP